MPRSNLLFLSGFPPDPDGNGPEQRAFRSIEALATRHRIHLLYPRRGRDPGPLAPEVAGLVEHRRALVVPVSWTLSGVVAEFLAPWWPRLACSLARVPLGWPEAPPDWPSRLGDPLPEGPVACIHLFRAGSTAFLPALRALYPEARIQLDYDDLESRINRSIAALHRERGEEASALIRQWNADWFARFEDEVLPTMDRVFLSSRRDVRSLSERLHGDLPVLLPNLPPRVLRRPPRLPPEGGRMRVLFVGTLGYAPNRDAIDRLLDAGAGAGSVGRGTEIHWIVAGRDDGRAAAELARRAPGLDLRPDCEDLAGLYAGCDAVVAPLRCVGGTCIKVLEAAVHGLPVVASPEVAESLEMVDGEHLLVARDRGEMVACLERLHGSPELASELVRNACRRIGTHHDPEAFGRVLSGEANSPGDGSP